jgi:hypothetical protein
VLDGDVEALLAVCRRQNPAVNAEQAAQVGDHVARIVDDEDAVLVLRPVKSRQIDDADRLETRGARRQQPEDRPQGVAQERTSELDMPLSEKPAEAEPEAESDWPPLPHLRTGPEMLASAHSRPRKDGADDGPAGFGQDALAIGCLACLPVVFNVLDLVGRQMAERSRS